MDDGVLELVLLLVIEDDAVVVDEVQESVLPFLGDEELEKGLVLPFLSGGGGTF